LEDLGTLPDVALDEGQGTELPSGLDTGGEEIWVVPDTILDVAVEELAPECLPGEGCFGDQCTENEQCKSGWCMEHMGEGLCSMACETECPVGWTCKQVAGTDPDIVYICVSDLASLCKPCADSDDCQSGVAEDVCVAYGEGTGFCGGSCADDNPCPEGFSCLDSETTEGVTLQQCVSDAGECECTEKSIQAGLFTPCQLSNEWGTCTGKRLCTEGGLTTCDAEEPDQEICNGADDDCDGDVDEPNEVGGDYVNLCNDGNDCTEDVCEGEAGCTNTPLAGTECIDGDPCTTADHCEAGECVSSPLLCDDGNGCTDDQCDESGACVFTPNNADCDDGEPCTIGDECDEGECAGLPVNCDCEADADCAQLEDGDVCNGTLYCDTAELPYICKIVPGSIVECPPPQGLDAVCLDEVCDPVTAECSFAPAFEGFACDDGDACTVGEACGDGSCTGGVAANCADDNLCTDDACDSTVGCVYVNNSAACSDGDVCTTEDFCVDGACAGGPALMCDDDNLCNGLESCDSLVGCLPGEPLVCDDGDPCNGDESCAPLTGCHPGEAPDCDDGNVCTDDLCVEGIGCTHSANSADCDDGNSCTADEHCEGGACVAATVTDCDDGNVCTDDSCDLVLGCINEPNNAPCNDDDLCTAGDTCADGQCMPGAEVDCADNNPCTDDSCTPETGCQFVPNEGECDDLNACTDGDFCDGGVCHPGDAVVCDDQNPCTTEYCDIADGCVVENNDWPCDDGDACTGEDLCVDGACVPGASIVCNDFNDCTDDTCHLDSGCVFSPNQAECDDNNACTTGDACAAGACVPGAPENCDDDNECTQEFCDASDGCTYFLLPEGSPCEAQGVCVGECSVGLCEDIAVEVCDGQDNDCDEEVDEDFDDYDLDGEKDCVDTDDDDDGDPDDSDCEPLNPDVFTGNEEVCGNGVDDDCNPATNDPCSMKDCKTWLDSGFSTGDGIYTIDPDEDGVDEAFEVYCDMTTDGGGWTLCLNSVMDSKSPSTDIVSNEGDADWNAGYTRNCSKLDIDDEVEIRHLIIDDDRNRVVNAYYKGKYHGTLPQQAGWALVAGDDAREGEEHTEIGGDCGFDYHFGRTWGCEGNCCNTYTLEWYYWGCWNYMPSVPSGGYCLTGPSDGCGGAPGSCIERYSIFVRPAVPGPGDTPELAGTDCKSIKDAAPISQDGFYWIDPDATGEPFQAYCDMTLDGGGWTRFNWVLQKYPNGQDPLALNLSECAVDATHCPARIPAAASPADLLVKDKSENQHAAWHFSGGTISNAVLGALQSKQQYCAANQGAFQPYINTSSEGYCGTGQEGGCDSFYYTSGSCLGAGNWGLHWDGDNHWCAAVFKMGATVAGGCGHDDQGFLNDCDCDDEQGELYYR